MASLDVVQVPPIHYAANDRGKLAYQDFGRGPALVIVPPLAQHIEMMWEQPAFWRPLSRLASAFRVVIFDKLGTGLSDPVPALSTMDQRVDELRTVLDSTGIERAWLLGLSEGGVIALAAAAGALAPRVEGLLLLSTYSGSGAIAQASAYGLVPDRAAYRTFFEEVVARWIPRYERAAASPAMIGGLMKSGFSLDATPLLSRVLQRTLIVHLSRDRVVP